MILTVDVEGVDISNFKVSFGSPEMVNIIGRCPLDQLAVGILRGVLWVISSSALVMGRGT